ncbi:MAG: ABC transporter permease subunit [Bdellovibrionota bacterium]
MERFFSIPGIGDTMITAINEGDFPILKAMTMLGALLYSFFNLLTDLLYALVDPRVKLS